jgi:hypothetical protein
MYDKYGRKVTLLYPAILNYANGFNKDVQTDRHQRRLAFKIQLQDDV